MNTFPETLARLLGPDRVSQNEPLARYCNWKVGGPADLLFTARSTDELVSAVRLAQHHSLPHTLLGFGANSLVSDRGIPGLVVINRAERIEFLEGEKISVDSGTNLALLVRRAADRGVGGLEFLIGIPGTVGAAIAGNAGTGGQWIGSKVVSASVLMCNGEIREYAGSDLEFGYRSSRLKGSGEVVLSAVLQGMPARTEFVRAKVEEMLQARRSQPPGPSAGSVFENPAGDFAGRLIEACGLKGTRMGGAEISGMHANFILNRGGASAADIKALIDLARKAVLEKFGIVLREEIRYLGAWD